jgi:hypothetical protein
VALATIMGLVNNAGREDSPGGDLEGLAANSTRPNCFCIMEEVAGVDTFKRRPL